MNLKYIFPLICIFILGITPVSYGESGETILTETTSTTTQVLQNDQETSGQDAVIQSGSLQTQVLSATGINEKTSPKVNQKVEVIGSPLPKDSILGDSIEDLKFIIDKELDSVNDISNINTAHDVTQRIKSDLLEQTNLVQHKISFSTNSIYYNSPKQDIKKLQEILKTIGLYKGEIDGKYDNIIKIVQQYQLNNNIVKSAQEGGYGRMGPKTKVQLEKDYLQAMSDKVYQEILSVVKSEIEKKINEKNKKTEVIKPITTIQNSFSSSEKNDANTLSTGEIQKIIDDQTKTHTNIVLNASILSVFIAQIYITLSIIAAIGYFIYRYQRRKKFYF